VKYPVAWKTEKAALPDGLLVKHDAFYLMVTM
jgi:hypothetical protein